MNANDIATMDQLIDGVNQPNVKIKYVKRDKGLMERTNNEKTIIVEGDNRQILLG